MFKLLLAVTGLLLLSGCTVRTYQLTRDRVDQNVSAGNRGYIMGGPKEGAVENKKTTRTVQIVEVELTSPIKFDTKAKKAAPAPVKYVEERDVEITGNRGYISSSDILEIDEKPATYKEYKVEKNDTLQKISQKFYGTTKKWNRIFEANKDRLKSANKLYPGQTIRIPEDGSITVKETLKETKTNLK
jgi:LysM repeat protein